jgi:hypothetical protein
VNRGMGRPEANITAPSGTTILPMSQQPSTAPGPEGHRRGVPTVDRPNVPASPHRRAVLRNPGPGWGLSDAEIDTLGALRRVGESDGAVMELGGRYFYRGHPMVPWLEGPLATLLAAGLITLADPDPGGYGARRVTVTETGRARYEELRADFQDSGWPRQLPGRSAAR